MANQFTLAFELLGRSTQNVKSYRMDSDYTTSTDGWTVELFEPDIKLIENLELQPVELLIDGNQQLLGRIDATTRGAGAGTTITIKGRDYFSDMVECHIDPSMKVKKDEPLETVIKRAASPVGITEVELNDDIRLRDTRMGRGVNAPGVGENLKSKKQEEYKANPGEGIYEFLNRIVARFGVTMQPGVKRNQVILASPDYAQTPAYKITRRLGAAPGANNNVLSASTERDFSSFPTHTLFVGKQGRGGKSKTAISISDAQELPNFPAAADLTETSRIKPGETNPQPKLYRLLYQRDENSRTQLQLDKAWLRRTADLLKDTLQYTVKLRDHNDLETGRLYAVDTLVTVNDEVCGVNEDLWVHSRRFEYTAEAGPTTTLVCWRKGTFQIT